MFPTFKGTRERKKANMKSEGLEHDDVKFVLLVIPETNFFYRTTKIGGEWEEKNEEEGPLQKNCLMAISAGFVVVSFVIVVGESC